MNNRIIWAKTLLAKILMLVITLTCLSPAGKVYASVSLPTISSSSNLITYTYNSSGKVYAYKDANLKTKTGGYIVCSTDECRIIKISGEAVQVKYPVSGGTKTAWFYCSDFTKRILGNEGAAKKFKCTKKVTTYKWKGKTNTFGSISSGDICYLLRGDQNSDWLQVIYPVSGGYKMGWVKGGDISPIIWPKTTAITLNKSSVTLTGKGSTTTLKATVTPSNSTQGVSWSSSNTGIATVSGGTVTAVAKGTATITATSGSKKATCSVTVVINDPASPGVVQPTGISLSSGDFKLTKIGQTYKLTATVTPGNATNKTVTWSTSNSSVATVSSSGVVTAKNNGTATISAKTTNGKTASVKVTVKLPAKKFGANLSKVPFYKQNSGDWKNYAYGYKNKSRTQKATIGSSGCGLLAVTNAVYYLNGKFINPKVLADYSLKNGFRIDGVGTAQSFCKSFISNKGGSYNVKYAGTVTGYSKLREGMNNGYVAVCSKPGHYMSIVDYNPSNKKFLLLDSAPSSARGTSNGYAWKTESQLKAMDLRTTFYLIKVK